MPAAAPSQMFEHALDYPKGYPREKQLDFEAAMHADVVKSPVYGGSCVHVELTSGVPYFLPGAKGTQMPLFLVGSDSDVDVSVPGGDHWTSISPAGKQVALVATGAYELATTEFLNAPTTYSANDILHSPTEDQVTSGSEADAGKLYKTRSWTGGNAGALTLYTDSVCGVVSRGKYTNQHRVSVLGFWPVYLPSASA
jgi:hypothetical protein